MRFVISLLLVRASSSTQCSRRFSIKVNFDFRSKNVTWRRVQSSLSSWVRWYRSVDIRQRYHYTTSQSLSFHLTLGVALGEGTVAARVAERRRVSEASTFLRRPVGLYSKWKVHGRFKSVVWIWPWNGPLESGNLLYIAFSNKESDKCQTQDERRRAKASMLLYAITNVLKDLLFLHFTLDVKICSLAVKSWLESYKVEISVFFLIPDWDYGWSRKGSVFSKLSSFHLNQKRISLIGFRKIDGDSFAK